MRVAKRNFYINRFNAAKDKIKDTWRLIDQFIRGNKNASNISLIDEHNSEQSNPKDVSNIFCKYFSSVAEEIDKDIPPSVIDPLNYLGDRNVNSFFTLPANPAEVRDIIMSFPNKKCKTDSIPTVVYKLVADHLSFIICDICNRSIEIGHYPDCLKVLRIIPIFKALSGVYTRGNDMIGEARVKRLRARDDHNCSH